MLFTLSDTSWYTYQHFQMNCDCLSVLCFVSLDGPRLVPDRGKRGAFSELTGTMSRAAGKKINRIITFSKRKPPPGEPSSTSTGHHDNPRCGEHTNDHLL